MARNLVRFDPLAEFSALTRDLFDGGIRAAKAVMPTTDVYTEDDDKAFVVEAHLPNFDESDVSVDVDRGALVIQAQRHEKEEDSKKKYVMRESTTSFYRSILLPEQADEAGIKAVFDKGVLKVTVPLTVSVAPRRIPIGEGGSAAESA
ncbi:Hsp20/alpha crystallin family protein [Microbacterium immunditiarum]|uniref:HSP20 family protein n=1 Tax=Microbacterium immunditiarum TaxID=337480 RepID=A0A7Y9KIH7_9MICO|nr:Hsp20/alpha crystallin family protein [Microbacterium immunditiarum]NYE20572.1 HSP20 family protein [Microbacterium immunditiarum]